MLVGKRGPRKLPSSVGREVEGLCCCDARGCAVLSLPLLIARDSALADFKHDERQKLPMLPRYGRKQAPPCSTLQDYVTIPELLIKAGLC